MNTIKKVSLKDFQAMSWDEREALPKKTKEIFERDDAIESLKKLLPQGSQVYTILRHVSASGMSRDISVVMVESGINDPQIQDITFYVARALGAERNNKNGGIKVTGCGMDMGFDLIHRLSAKIYGHENRGGYFINQGWL